METRPALKSAGVSQLPVPTKCPLTAALNAIGGKWSLICLYWLDSGTRRFNELRRLMPEISHKVLAATLRGLEHEGLICRTVHAEVPQRVEYRISGHGETVRPIIQAVRAWGQEHLEWKRLEDETNPLLNDFHMIAQSDQGEGRSSILVAGKPEMRLSRSAVDEGTQVTSHPKTIR